jgi:hypothetical protein
MENNYDMMSDEELSSEGISSLKGWVINENPTHCCFKESILDSEGEHVCELWSEHANLIVMAPDMKELLIELQWFLFNLDIPLNDLLCKIEDVLDMTEPFVKEKGVIPQETDGTLTDEDYKSFGFNIIKGD